MATDGSIPQYRVQVFLYDLSMGMARGLSQQFLGKQLDGIWHTGIVVYNYEYFYGGGIQASRPGKTHAGTPVQRIDMGYTSTTQSAFHEWLRSVTHRFTPETYSLLSHNCNNFTHEAVKFLTGRDIPAYITGLPAEALNTPFGAMLVPLITQMEGNLKNNAGGGVIPWGPQSLFLPALDARPDRYHVPSATDDAPPQQSTHRPAEAAAASTIAPAVPASPGARAPAHPHAALNLTQISASSKPLTSTDTKAAPFMALIKNNAKKIRDNALTDNERQLLDSLVTSISSPSATSMTDETSIIQLCTLFERLINDWPVEYIFPVIGLYRAFVLRPSVAAYVEDHYHIVKQLLAFIPENDQTTNVAPMAAQSMSLCAVANLYARPSLATKLAHDSHVINVSRTALSSIHNTVRLMSATIIYNSTLSLPKDDNDIVIELVSALSEIILDEEDVMICTRLLLALAHLIYGNSIAATLLMSLEWIENSRIIHTKFANQTQILTLMNEINLIINYEQSQLTLE